MLPSATGSSPVTPSSKLGCIPVISWAPASRMGAWHDNIDIVSNNFRRRRPLNNNLIYVDNSMRSASTTHHHFVLNYQRL